MRESASRHCWTTRPSTPREWRCSAAPAASRGRAGVRSAAPDSPPRARPRRPALASSIAVWATALRALARGRPEETISRLVALRAAPPGVGHPLIALTSTPDLVEAYVRTGDDDQARTACRLLDDFTRAGAPAWA